MPLGFANFRHDVTGSSSRDGQQQQQQQAREEQNVSSSAASIASEQSLTKEKEDARRNADGATAKRHPLKEMFGAIKPKQ